MKFLQENLEKIIAWIANVVVIVLEIKNLLLVSPFYVEGVKWILPMMITSSFISFFPIVATLLIKRRILSSILFIISSILILLINLGSYWIFSLIYIIVAMLLLIRKVE